MTASVEVGSLTWLFGQVLSLVVVALVWGQAYRLGRAARHRDLEASRSERDS